VVNVPGAIVLAVVLVGALVPGCSLPASRGSVTPPPGGAPLSKALRDSFPGAVSYPAVPLGPEASGVIGDSIRGAIIARYGGPDTFEYDAYASPGQPFLDKSLPNAVFVRAFVRGRLVKMSRTDRFAVTGSKVYDFEGLNELLLAAGFTFDSTEMPVIAKTTVLLATFGKTLDASGQPSDGAAPSGSVPGAGFPAIAFLSATRDTWRLGTSPRADGIRVQCLVDGVRRAVFVGFWDPDEWGRRGVEVLNSGGLQFAPVPIRLPRPGAVRQRG
jgi:hypothetical protein